MVSPVPKLFYPGLENGRASVVEHLFYQCPCDQTSTLALEGEMLQAVLALTFQGKYVKKAILS